VIIKIIRKEEEISSAKIARSILFKNKADLTRNAVRCKENLTQFLNKRRVELVLLVCDALLTQK
jgi:hypothetical protein